MSRKCFDCDDGKDPCTMNCGPASARIETERPVFDYYKTMMGLQSRFVLSYEPALRRITIEDLNYRRETGFVYVNTDDTEIGLVIRDAIVSYHLLKAEAAFNKANPNGR